jgi:hypothetical protein
MLWNLKLLAVAATLTVTSLVGTAMYAHNKGSRSGMLQIQTQWDAERMATKAAQDEELMKARQREQALQALVNKQRRAHDAEVKRVVREYGALVDGLRDRPEARAGDGGVPEGADAGAGCTGAGLAGPDARFLAGYAADAARLQLALDACKVAYDEVRRAVNGEQAP